MVERFRSLRRSINDSFEDTDRMDQYKGHIECFNLSSFEIDADEIVCELDEIECTVTVGGDDEDDEPDSGTLEDYPY